MALLGEHVRAVLGRLENVRDKGTGNGWDALCPAHDDRRRSLSVSIGRDGKVLLKCFAGCPTEEVVAALGLSMSDLWPKDDPPPHEKHKDNGQPWQFVEAYDYEDETGVLRFRVMRWEPKNFTQRRPMGNGEWAPTLAGGLFRRSLTGKWERLPDGSPALPTDRRLELVRPFLYRLPGLVNADPTALVFIPEGEKDVDALLELGLVATCNPMGAGKWAARYADWLKGRRVVVLPDNDEAGSKHADTILQSLQGVASTASRLLLPGLPYKGDVSDWLAAGGLPEQLVALAEAALSEAAAPPAAAAPAAGAPAFGPIVLFSQLRLIEDDARWLWHGYLARASITLLSALWKAGKTTLLAYLLRALESEGTFCGQAVVSSRVLYVTEEHESLWAERRDEIGIADHVHALVRPFMSKPDAGQWLAFIAWLAGEIRGREYDLIVLDTISNLWPVRDENDAARVQEALMPLRYANETACLLLVHHHRKSDGQEATAARGSGALPAFVDTILELRRYDAGDRKDRRRVLTGYGRYRDTTDEAVVELTDTGFVAHGDRADVTFREISSGLCVLLPSLGDGWTAEDILAADWPEDLGKAPGKTRLNEALASAVRAGLLVRLGEGKRGDPFRYRRAALRDE
jgi:AAA domain